MADITIVFIDEDGKVHTGGQLGYVRPGYPLDEPEPGANLYELDVIFSFVRNSFAPDHWVIEDGEVKRFLGNIPLSEEGEAI